VTLVKRTGRWIAQCQIGGKLTSLGHFDSEEEAVRAWDRFKLWSCKADDGRKKEELKLNFSVSEYTDDGVTALQSLTQDEMVKKLQGTEERVTNQTSKYRGVSLVKKTGRWEAKCTIGGKLTFLGNFHSEEDAARACDRARSWSCKADGKTKEEVEKELKFSLSEYCDDEVGLGLTQEEMVKKLQRAGQEERVARQTSQYAGVSIEKSIGRWRADCRIGGKKT
jgi:hypothetical protein